MMANAILDQRDRGNKAVQIEHNRNYLSRMTLRIIFREIDREVREGCQKSART